MATTSGSLAVVIKAFSDAVSKQFSGVAGQLTKLSARIKGVEDSALPIIGSNANGRYIRYPDGRQVCELSIKSWNVAPEDWSYWSSTGLYYIRTPVYSFPASFIEPPVITAELDEYAWRRSQGRGIVNTTGCTLSFIRETATTFSNSRLAIIAEGRWKN